MDIAFCLDNSLSFCLSVLVNVEAGDVDNRDCVEDVKVDVVIFLSTPTLTTGCTLTSPADFGISIKCCPAEMVEALIKVVHLIGWPGTEGACVATDPFTTDTLPFSA